MKGFTLIEVMIVMCIVGVLAAIVVGAGSKDREPEQLDIREEYTETRTIIHNYTTCFIVAVDDYGYEQEKLIIDCDELAGRLAQ